jgi:hypothetical protein
MGSSTFADVEQSAIHIHPALDPRYSILAEADPGDLNDSFFIGPVCDSLLAGAKVQMADDRVQKYAQAGDGLIAKIYLEEAEYEREQAKRVYEKETHLAKLAMLTNETRLDLAHRARVTRTLAASVLTMIAVSTPMGIVLDGIRHEPNRQEASLIKRELDSPIVEALAIGAACTIIAGSRTYRVSGGDFASRKAHAEAVKIAIAQEANS